MTALAQVLTASVPMREFRHHSVQWFFPRERQRSRYGSTKVDHDGQLKDAAAHRSGTAGKCASAHEPAESAKTPSLKLCQRTAMSVCHYACYHRDVRQGNTSFVREMISRIRDGSPSVPHGHVTFQTRLRLFTYSAGKLGELIQASGFALLSAISANSLQ